MPLMNLSLSIGTQPLVYLPPPRYGNFDGRFPTRVSMLLQHLSQRKGFGFVSKSKRLVFACNSALNAKCSQGQTQTLTRKNSTIPQAPNNGKDKSLKLDDSGNGFPPRDDGGGGGGGGGGESFSGGFFLFGFLMFMGYLKDMEGEHENSH